MTGHEDFAAVALADDARLIALIGRIVVRDEEALTLLYDDTVARVWAVVLRFTHDGALAEEVVEDVYWQAWRQAPRFDPERGPPLAWLLTIARTRAIDALRRERLHRERLRARGGDDAEGEAGANVADPAPQPPEAIALAHETRRLHTAIARLKAHERELLVLAYFRGLTHDEIAVETALPLGTVKSRIRRTLLTLRQGLNDAAAAGGATV